MSDTGSPRRLAGLSPQRLLSWSTGINAVGSGLLMTASVLYFTQVVGLSARSVGLGLTVAGLVAVAAGVPVGRSADRYGPRTVCVLTLSAQAVSTFAMLAIHSFLSFLVVVCLDMLASAASQAARGPLIRRVGGEGAAGYRARLRATTNAGLAMGTAAAAVAIDLNTRGAYEALIVADALSFLVCAALVAFLPRYEPLPASRGNALREVVSDRPFLLVSLINGFMTIQYYVLLIPLPIWIVAHSNAPRWCAAMVLIVNTGLCVLLQVRLGARIDTPAHAGRAMRTAGLLFLVSCPLMGLIVGLPPWAAIVLLVLAVAVHTFGEIQHASAGFTLSFELAPAHAQGQYTGVFAICAQLGTSIAASLLTVLCIDAGRTGWLVLGVLFAVVGSTTPAAVRLAERRRSTELVPTTSLGASVQ